MASPLAAPATPGLCPGSDWFCGKYITERRQDLVLALQEHISLTVAGVLISLVVAFGLGLLALRARWLESIILAGSSLLYAVPSLALLAIVVPIIGLSNSRYAVLLGLVLYSLVILVRAVVTGLRGVPAGVVEAARGMGFGAGRLLFRVQLPLALPTIFAGLRVATVSTVALVTLGTVVDHGGLGNLLSEAFRSNYRFEALTAAVLCVALAIIGDLLLLLIERLVSPWRRRAGSA